MMLADTVRHLCAAIDSGDDSALMPLSDALEEAGDKRAEGLRWAVMHEKLPGRRDVVPFTRRRCLYRQRWQWTRWNPGWTPTDGLESAVFMRLKRPQRKNLWAGYPSRSAAFLAARRGNSGGVIVTANQWRLLDLLDTWGGMGTIEIELQYGEYAPETDDEYDTSGCASPGLWLPG